MCLLLSHHVLRQKGLENPHPRPLPAWGLSGSQTLGISQSACPAGAFCWLFRDAGRCKLESPDLSQETSSASGRSHLIGSVPSHVTAAGLSAAETEVTRCFLLDFKCLRYNRPYTNKHTWHPPHWTQPDLINIKLLKLDLWHGKMVSLSNVEKAGSPSQERILARKNFGTSL